MFELLIKEYEIYDTANYTWFYPLIELYEDSKF